MEEGEGESEGEAEGEGNRRSEGSVLNKVGFESLVV